MEACEEQKIKGVIICPCCGKQKTVVYQGTTGSESHRCPTSGRMIKYDFDKMTAEIVKPIRSKFLQKAM